MLSVVSCVSLLPYPSCQRKPLTSQSLLHRHLQATLFDRLINVRSQIGQNLQWQITKWPRLLLQQPAWIALRKADTKMRTNTLEEANPSWLARIVLSRRLRKRIQVSYQTTDILIPTIRLESQLMLQRYRKRSNQIQRRHLPQQILLPQSWPVLLIIPPLITMHPNHARQTLTRQDKLGPVFPAIIVAFVRCR